MSKEKELLNVLLGKAYNKAPDEVAALLYKKADDDTITDELYDDADARLFELDRDRIAKLAQPSVDTTALYNKAVQETEGKIHGKWENNIRSTYGVDPEKKLKGEALIMAAKAAADKSNAYNPEEVKISTEYRALEKSMQESLEAKDAEWNTKFEEQQTAFQRQQAWGETSKEIRMEFKALGPVLPLDSTKADRQVEDFVNLKFQGYDFKKMEDGQTVVMKDGKVALNAHGHTLYLPDLVKQIGDQYFDFVKQPAAGNAGNTNERTTVKTKFKDEDDFGVQYNAEIDPDKKEALAQAWELQERG